MSDLGLPARPVDQWTTGDLFAGIGGFSLAARWVGWRTAWYSEIEPYASRVMAKHFGHAPNLGDITKITDAPPVDVLCGGFPCQDISLAGKGAGLAGARSGLWKEYKRLIDAGRPRWVVAENVAALRTRGLETVLADLAEIGYDAEWHCIPASAVGAPHRRDRIWILARPAGLFPDPICTSLADASHGDGVDVSGVRRTLERQEGRRVAGDSRVAEGTSVADPTGDGRGEECAVAGGRGEGSGAEGDHRSGSPLSRDVDDTVGPRLEGHTGDGGDTGREGPAGSAPTSGLRDGRDAAGWWATEPDVGRVAHGVPHRVDRLRCLGNAIVPQVAYYLFRQIIAAELRLAAEIADLVGRAA